MNANQLIRLRPPRIAMGLAIFAFLANALYPAAVAPPLPLLAAAVAATGFSIMLRAWWLFRKVETPICPTATPLEMVAEDVFALTRNPMYLGMTAMLAALALLFGTIPFIGAAVVYWIVMDRVFCVYEERAMLQKFGASYEAYRRRVRRWL